jgi:ADP-heptose:LPS heptosyltransferase
MSAIAEAVALPPTARILVLQLQQIGDSIVATPMLRAVRERYPGATLDIIASPAAAEVHRKNPRLDGVRVHGSAGGRVTRWLSWARLLMGVRRRRYDCVLACANHVSVRHALIAWWSRAPVRVGFTSGKAGFLFNHRVDAIEGEPVSRANLRVAAAVSAYDDDPVGECWYGPEDENAVSALLAASGVSAGAPLAVLHVGSNWQSKTWYPERWTAVAEDLARRGMQPVLVGTVSDAETGREVQQGSRVPVLSLIGQTDISQLAALLRRADLFVGTDSGPRHVAAAVGCRQVTVMSSVDEPWRWLVSSDDIVLRTDPYCAGCLRDHCAHRRCMDQITTSHVVEACGRALRLARPVAASGHHRFRADFAITRTASV